MPDAIPAIFAFVALVLWVVTRHPFFCLPLLVAGSLLLEDDVYPFSDFPMYSDPDESENYLYLATPGQGPDGKDHIPLASRTLTGLTAPKLKKIHKTYLDDYAREHKIKRDDIPADERAKIGQENLRYFKDQGEQRKSDMPDTLLLMEVWIEANKEGAGFTETTTEIARIGSAPKTPVIPPAPADNFIPTPPPAPAEPEPTPADTAEPAAPDIAPPAAPAPSPAPDVLPVSPALPADPPPTPKPEAATPSS